MQSLVDFYCQSRYRENELVFLSLVNPVGGKLLDLGCDNGSFTLKIAKKAKAKEVYGIEINKRKAIEAKGEGINVTGADLNQEFKFKDDFFDTITANQVIEHLYFTDRFTSEIKRVLKPDGQLIISTTNLAALHYRLQLLIGQQPICLHPSSTQFGNFLKGNHNPKYGHKSVFTHKAFVEFLKHCGFNIKKATAVGLYPLPSILSRPILKIFPNFGVFSTVLAQARLLTRVKKT